MMEFVKGIACIPWIIICIFSTIFIFAGKIVSNGIETSAGFTSRSLALALAIFSVYAIVAIFA